MAYFGIFLALLRFSTFLFFVPFFNRRNVPPQLVVALAGLMALLAAPDVGPEASVNSWGFVVLVMQEVAVGLVLTLCVTLIYMVMYFAGQLVDYPLGFGMVSLFDPQTGMQIPLFAQFYQVFGTLVFFAIDGHVWLFRAILGSYRLVPVGGLASLSLVYDQMMWLGQNLFVLGLQLALPFTGTIILTDIALGIMTKTVPQINVFVLGLPIKNLLGISLMVIVLPLYVTAIAGIFGNGGMLHTVFHSVLASLGGR